MTKKNYEVSEKSLNYTIENSTAHNRLLVNHDGEYLYLYYLEKNRLVEKKLSFSLRSNNALSLYDRFGLKHDVVNEFKKHYRKNYLNMGENLWPKSFNNLEWFNKMPYYQS